MTFRVALTFDAEHLDRPSTTPLSAAFEQAWSRRRSSE
jgi:hypothetical protein